MTETQKEQIWKLRSEGLGYVKIAREIGVSENTVKSFCRRNAKAEAKTDMIHVRKIPQKHFCLQCGTEVEQTAGRKEKKFCSDRCRRKWWNAHPNEVHRRKMHQHKCLACGREFEVYGSSKRKYCSHECYIKARFRGGAAHD